VAVALIITLAQIPGQLADRFGQPQLSAWLFSPAVRSQRNLLGQLGLALFMLLVGLELNPKLLQGRIPLASRITSVGVVLPLLLGLALAQLFEAWQPELLPGDHAVAGALFMGTAMAGPLLARLGYGRLSSPAELP
jgi:Kef-type K+ transport system membrane component KefB